MDDLRQRTETYLRDLQERITARLSTLADAKFEAKRWERPGGGGGEMRVMRGALFEKGGVNFSAVAGDRYPTMAEGSTPSLPDGVAAAPGEVAPHPPEAAALAGQPFFATGVSLVLHPASPFVPIVHLNVRYLEVGGRRWFGGGADLTPCVPFDDDTRHFHDTLRVACAPAGPTAYERFSAWCDQYFYLAHRKSRRGVGGVFFDYLPGDERSFALVRGLGDAFLEAYVPLVERRRATPFGEAEREALLRFRGRYVEFNLVYDRGTLFGLKTGGNLDAIFMSLPPLVAW